MAAFLSSSGIFYAFSKLRVHSFARCFALRCLYQIMERKAKMSKLQDELRKIKSSQNRMERRIEFLSCGILFIISSTASKTCESTVGQVVGNIVSVFAMVAQIILGVMDIKETWEETDEQEE